MGNLKQTELQRLKTEEREAEDIRENKKTENHKKQRLATLKRLKRVMTMREKKTGEGGR